jgi:hypothetical protein
MTPPVNLLDGPEPTLLPDNAAPREALAAGVSADQVAREHPADPLPWAVLADEAFAADRVIEAYAFSRTGYHRGLDLLRRNGWKGFGPVPYRHEPNRGFLRCVAALARAADDIGETDEFGRCLDLLDDCDPTARTEFGLSS